MPNTDLTTVFRANLSTQYINTDDGINIANVRDNLKYLDINQKLLNGVGANLANLQHYSRRRLINTTETIDLETGLTNRWDEVLDFSDVKIGVIVNRQEEENRFLQVSIKGEEYYIGPRGFRVFYEPIAVGLVDDSSSEASEGNIVVSSNADIEYDLILIGSGGTNLFNIDHETGDLTQYDSTLTDSGDLSASLTAGLRNAEPYSRQYIRTNDEYHTIPNNTDLSTGDIIFSAGIWVYMDTKVADMVIAGKYTTTGDQREWHLRYDVGSDEFQTFFSPDGTSGTTGIRATAFGSPSAGQWYFIVTEHDSVNNTITIQINNGTISSGAYSVGVFDGTSSFDIGQRGDGANNWNGRLAQASFRKGHLLTTADRTELYNNGLGKRYRDYSPSLKIGLISAWDLDETAGDAIDSHGQNHLTDTNTVTSVKGSVGVELISNGRFDNWTADDPDDWTVAGEVATDPEVSEVGTGEGHGGVGTGLCNIFTSDATSVSITQAIVTEVGKRYQVTMDVDTVTSGEIRLRATSGDLLQTAYETVGSKSLIFVAGATSTDILIIRNAGNDDVTIDNVSCREVTWATYGLECEIDGTGAIYGQKDFVTSDLTSGVLRQRFYIDPSQLEMATLDTFTINQMRVDFEGSVLAIVGIHLDYSGTSFELKFFVRDDSNSLTNSVASYEITSEEHYIELVLNQATTATASDGSASLYIDGVFKETISSIDNFDRYNAIANIRLGATANIDSGTLGHLFLDELVVRNIDNEIGA